MKRSDGKFPEVVELLGSNDNRLRKHLSNCNWSEQEILTLQNLILKDGLDFPKLCKEFPKHTRVQIY